MKKDTSIEKRTLQSTIAGLLSFVLSMGQSILIVPILLKFWGEEKYATWLALWSFVLVMRTFDAGFLSLIGNAFTLTYHRDKEEAFSILGSAVRISAILGLLEIVAFVGIWLTGQVTAVSGVPDQPEMQLSWAFFISMLPWAIGGAVVSVILRAIPAMNLYTKMIYFSMIMKILEISVLIAGGVGALSILQVSVMMCFASMGYVAILFVFLKRLMRENYPWWKRGSFKEGYKYLIDSLGITMNSFLEQYANTGLIILISKSLGLIFLPVFTTIRTLTNTSVQITTIVLDPLLPDILRFHAKGEQEKIAEVFRVNWLLMSILVNVSFAVCLLFIEPLYNIWTVHKLTFDYSLFYLLIISVSAANFGRPFVAYIRGLNAIRQINILTIVRFLLLFLCTIALIDQHKLRGIGVGVLVSEIVASAVLPYWFIRKYVPSLTTKDLILGIAPIFLISILFILRYVTPSETYWIYLILFLMIQAFISKLQWERVDTSTHRKILGLIPFLRKYA